MTYEKALEWLEANVNKYDYDTFRDWYEACKEKIQTPNLFDNPDFNRELEDSWLNEFGSFDREEIDVTPSDIPSGQQEITIDRQPPIKLFSKAPIIIQKLPEEVRILPITGKAPLPEPIAVVLPTALPIEQKRSIWSRIVSLFRRKK